METENKKCKLRLKDVSKPNEPFEIRSLDKFREVGSYTWIAEKITDEVGFPDCVKETDECHCCEGQLFIMRHGAEETSQSTDSFGQVITIINHETGKTNIFTRALHPAQNNGYWQPWQMVATGDSKLIAENNSINEVLSTLRQQVEKNSKHIETTKALLLTNSTVRFDIIEENEATINSGEIGSTPTAIVYHKPANKFVAADSAGNYWDTWDGMDAYMSGGAVRKDKVYLCGYDIYILNGDVLFGVQKTATDKLTAVNNTIRSVIQNVDEEGFYICDDNGNIIALIDKDGNFDSLGIGSTLSEILATVLGVEQIHHNTKNIEDVKTAQTQIEEKVSQIETTEENGFYVCDGSGNVVLAIDENGNTKFVSSNTKDKSLYKQVNLLTEDVAEIKAKADAVDSLLSIKKSGEYYSSTIAIPSSTSDRRNVILRVGLHHGNVIGNINKESLSQSDIYNDIFFDGKCEKTFSDIRFLSENTVLEHRLEHHGNYEVVRDNNFAPGVNFGIDYETGIVYQGEKYTSDGGVTWQSIPNWNHGNIVFVDSRKILYSFKNGKVFATKKTNGIYDGENTIEICDVTTTSTGNYSSAYPTQGSRAIIEDNDGYIYFGTNGPEWNAVIFRSVNPDMTPTDGAYVREVFSQKKTYKEDGSLDYEVIDQHVHNFYHHRGTNTVYVGLDNSMRPYGPRVIKTTNNGKTWEEVSIDSKEWIQQRGRDYIPAYISPDGSYMLGGGEVNILGGQTMCKIYNTVADGKINESSIKSVISNGTGLRNIASFGEGFIVAGVNAGSGGNSDIQLLLSEDNGENWKTIYSENVPSSISNAGAGARWFSEPFSPNGEEERILITGSGAGSSMQFSPLVLYKGNSHYYGEAYVYIGDIRANEIKEITVESGYLAQMPNLVREERLMPVYSIPLNEGAGNIVTDSRGNHYKIQGEYEWDSYNTNIRFGNHVPILKDTKGLHGLKLMDGAFIELGKVTGLDFNKGFSITFWYKWDSDLFLSDEVFMDNFYNKIGPVLSSENYRIGLYRAGYAVGNINNNVRGAGCRVIHRNMYELVCLSVTNDNLPQIVISRNDDYGKQTSVQAPSSWMFNNLSDMTLRVGAPTDNGCVNYPIFIHSISIYDRVLTVEEVQSLYKGGIRL